MTTAAIILLGGFAVAWNQRFLRAARERNLAVLLLDAPGPHVDRLLDGLRRNGIDDVAFAAPGDLAGVADRCAEWATSGRYDVRGVCCLREDFVEPAAVVADLLGLPSPGLRAARVCRNKYLQRRYLIEFGPASTLVPPGEHEAAARTWDRFPVVVKPVGRLASSGVRLVDDPVQLRQSLVDYRADEALLFEERVGGPEYSVESLHRDGEPCYTEVTEKRTTEADSAYFVEMGHTTPPTSLSPAVRWRLLRTHEAILRRLRFGTGMAHAEYRVATDGRPVLIEIAVRPPGDSILALHWLATGAPLEDALVGLSVGETVYQPAAQRYARQVYLPHRPGTLVGVHADPALGQPATWFDAGAVVPQVAECGAASDPPALRCVVALKPPGYPLGPLRESGDRAAMFVADAATPAELGAFEARCRAAITVEVSS